MTGVRGDVKGMRAYMRTLGFLEGPDNERVLLDDNEHNSGKHEACTQASIQEGIKWLAKGADVGDSLLFYFAGHGNTIPAADAGSSEEEQEYHIKEKHGNITRITERRDQTIWGLDGEVTDDWIFDHLVAKLRACAAVRCCPCIT